MSHWDDELEGGDGGGIATFDGTTPGTYFNENEYGASLRLVATFDNPELFPAKEDGQYQMFYPCGKGWHVADDGARIVHDDGPDKKFRKDSDIGRLFEQLKKVEGLREARPDFDPYVAKSYDGLHATF